MASTRCSACGATASLSRCSQCQWVAYCSKDCQRRHWTRGSHRTRCPLLQRTALFRRLEETFWTSWLPVDIAFFRAQQDGLDPASMRFYGEVLFFLVGLKPCMMFSNLPPSWRKRFITEVLQPSGIVDGSLQLYVVVAKTQTPAAYSLQDSLLLVNLLHPECTGIDQTLGLVPVSLDSELPEYSKQPNQSVRMVEESVLARLLDYPIALDECIEPMIEVGYFAIAADGTRQLLMSYCASAVTAHTSRIREHFGRYQQAIDPATLTLAIETTPLS